MRVPRLTMDMLAAVIAVARKKAIPAAAEELALTASAVHKRVRNTSKLLGTPLFMVTEDGMVLTEAGTLFVRDAERAVEQALLAEDRITALLEVEGGRLLVGHSAYLPPRFLINMLKLHFDDRSRYRIEHIPGLTADIAKRVVEGTAHAGFGELPVDEAELISHLLWEEGLVVCMPAGHPLSVKPAVRPQELEGEPIIAIGREPLSRFHHEIEDFFAGFGIRLQIVADAFGPPEAVVMVEQKVGLCLLAPSDISRASVTGKPLTPRTLTRKYGLFVREDNDHAALKSFVDLALEKFAKRR